jgi:ParB family transcriptional regulator, chromosome partitioning protein
MTSRKDQLKNLFQHDAPETPAAPARAASGAVKAMGLSLGNLQRELDEAREAGERVIEIDPKLIDASPYADRLSNGADNDEDFAALVISIRSGGQQVPVLVRPDTSGRYVAAYGHRRIKAALELGIAVKAIVRQLSDAALLLAQGKENAERRNLSFIEKAMFVRSLMDAGIDRAAAQEALSLHKAEMTRMIQIGQMIPLSIARAVGPAPKVGRPRWMMLGALLKGEAARIKAEDETGRDGFIEAQSDRRFQMLFDRLAKKAKARPAQRQLKAAGILVSVTKSGQGARFDVTDAGFAAFLEENFARLAVEYAKAKT